MTAALYTRCKSGTRSSSTTHHTGCHKGLDLHYSFREQSQRLSTALRKACMVIA